MIARSVCGLKISSTSASSLERCPYVDSTKIFTCFAVRRRSVMRDHSTGCISAMFEPHSTNASACSASSYTPIGSSAPKVRMKPITAEAMQ